MGNVISGLRAGRICWNVHTLVVRRQRVVRRWRGCMLHKKIGYCWCTHTHAAATHSWGVPCPGEGGLLNLRRRNGDGPR